MAIIDKLMDGSESDIQVLRSLDAQGDNFSTFRDVDFLIEAPSKEKAGLICGFINDYNYGTASVLAEHDGLHRVQVIIHMPINQHIISSTAGFMLCVASLFDGTLNGWGCVAQTAT
ncbi:ribonuclease E inhibitor RraB [Microbulbifer hydrolyticus]|uniref:Ribonuclease E inhibitor RraB n=1 Tax=Microbulbifer hydrolyticus TaxID=48074 RepID=A0A6P1T4S6_9GAMM|nr:ribonuclease E inhibitor RraB [Microbulbifer hydrolyticus]MBB5211507.1 hypothetical protein [Microbulbifer hydrolyticus]QHQ37748.1 ribonuclease E inhibitor RraB [Microbulbifer hydrolyticus]